VQRGWGFLRGEFGEFVELLPPQQWLDDRWYAGTADAVFQNLDIVKRHGQVRAGSAGDHITRWTTVR
jgi:glucose-1-phosphate adenylyltransferase